MVGLSIANVVTCQILNYVTHMSFGQLILFISTSAISSCSLFNKMNYLQVYVDIHKTFVFVFTFVNMMDLSLEISFCK